MQGRCRVKVRVGKIQVKKPKENLLSWTTFSYRFVDFLPARYAGGYGLRQSGSRGLRQMIRVLGSQDILLNPGESPETVHSSPSSSSSLPSTVLKQNSC